MVHEAGDHMMTEGSGGSGMGPSQDRHYGQSHLIGD